MKGKIGGIVRQIEAGDELSGSIINPHPLLFNILKSLCLSLCLSLSLSPPHSHTHSHTHAYTHKAKQSRAAARCNAAIREEYEKSGFNDPFNVKGICCSPEVLK